MCWLCWSLSLPILVEVLSTLDSLWQCFGCCEESRRKLKGFKILFFKELSFISYLKCSVDGIILSFSFCNCLMPTAIHHRTIWNFSQLTFLFTEFFFQQWNLKWNFLINQRNWLLNQHKFTSLQAETTCETISSSGKLPVCCHTFNFERISSLSIFFSFLSVHNVLRLQMSWLSL